MGEVDYDKFNETRLMPSLIVEVCILSLFIPSFFSCISVHSDT